MGTRGFVGLKVDGEVYAQYQQHDSYPGGAGAATVRAARAMLDSVDALRTRVPKLRFVAEQDKFDEADRNAFGHLWQDVSSSDDWYSLLRGQQGDIAACLHSGVMCRTESDAAGRPVFGLDSLFCEWAFIVDLDDECVDSYEGFRKSPPTDGLWAGEVGESAERGYYPIQRVNRLPFTDLARLTDEDVWDWARSIEDREEADV